MIQDSQATILWGLPSFVRRILDLAEESGLRYPGVRLAAVSGEPCSAGLREDIQKRLQRLGSPNRLYQQPLWFHRNEHGFRRV